MTTIRTSPENVAGDKRGGPSARPSRGLAALEASKPGQPSRQYYAQVFRPGRGTGRPTRFSCSADGRLPPCGWLYHSGAAACGAADCEPDEPFSMAANLSGSQHVP